MAKTIATELSSARRLAAVGAERFELEIETTANLRHPHIVPLYDSGEVELEARASGEGPQKLLYYVMPQVEGESLRERIDLDKQLPIDEALRIASEVADALSYAHARGVVHRDIKPENILLEGGHAVVADFGIARALRAAGGVRITQTGMSVGTPSYMSPEQAAGDSDIDGRSDLYSLACVLYEMLGGQPPFTGANAATIARQHMIANPPPITNLRPSVPAAVVDALQRALSKSPADRFNPVTQFGAAIASGAGSAASVSTANVNAEPTVKSGGARRNVLALVAVAVIAVVTALSFWKNKMPDAATTSTGMSAIAVLPFADLSADHSSAYLGDGVAETLINALVNVPGLTVTARTSAFSFRGREADVKDIGKQLKVQAVLTGSVQRSGDKLRITAQLVNAATGVNLWSDSFDRPANDIFAVQDEVAKAAVTALKLQLAPGSTAGTVLVGTRNAEAYNAYMLGRFHWNLRTSAGEAYISLGNLLDSRGRDAEAAEAFANGIRLSPNYPTGHQWYSYSLVTLNRWDEAVSEMEVAHRLDPLSHVITLSLAIAYDGSDRFA